jgi:ribonuclease E
VRIFQTASAVQRWRLKPRARALRRTSGGPFAAVTTQFILPNHHEWARRAAPMGAQTVRPLRRRPPAPKEFTMANKMLIDAAHPEETRVVVLRGNRVEEFDFESASKKPLRGNIYLAKVTRVEPSLQAAFVDYGGNRHGFLAFSEIHPDYYQIPVADRQALIDEEAREQRDEEADEPRAEKRSRRHRHPRESSARARHHGEASVSEPAPDLPGETFAEPPYSASREHDEGQEDLQPLSFDEAPAQTPAHESEGEAAPESHVQAFAEDEHSAGAADESNHESEAEDGSHDDDSHEEHEEEPLSETFHDDSSVEDVSHKEGAHEDDEPEVTTLGGGSEEPEDRPRSRSRREERSEDEGEAVEMVGGDAMEEMPRRPPRLRRQYKIQEVIKRRQVLLIQVVKEERGNKGAALTTYLSLAGRYSVLMPNTARGGGISRKITNSLDRSRLKSIAQELEVPEGMGVILRTAGASRTKPEVKRDFEYLLRMWETVRETTLSSSAPTLVYEEGSLIKRAIRDLYNKDIDEVVVAGDTGYREARDFMRLLMPSHVPNVHLWRDSQPVFARAGVEAQLDAMFQNQVTLKSGGYIVINQTEALVAIDVNSGRSTREHNIEDTALRTNLEAADEVARQLRLRDLAGLIVVDFIDMEEGRNNRAVERRIKDALKNDRARIQVGRISHFGLLEMSRQRIRAGVLEGSTIVCQHCMGAGVVRSTASIALHVLRVLEDNLIRSATHNVTLRLRTEVALYILNQKRAHLRELEKRFGVAIMIAADETLTGANYHALERGEPAIGVKEESSEATHSFADEPMEAFVEDEVEVEEPADSDEEGEAEPLEAGGAPRGEGEDGEGARKRRRKRRRRGGRDRGEAAIAANAPQPTDEGLAVVAEIGGDILPMDIPPGDAEREPRAEGEGEDRYRRGRGGRGHRDRGRRRYSEAPLAAEGELLTPDEPASTSVELENAAPFFERQAPEVTPPDAPEGAEPMMATDTHEAHHETPQEAPHEAPDVALESGDRPAYDTPDATTTAEDPARPKRSGWWQRARASIVGE